MSLSGDRAKNILTNAGNKRRFLAYFEPFLETADTR